MRSLFETVAIVQFFLDKGKTLEEAIKEGGVPVELEQHVKNYFAPPLTITNPDILWNPEEPISRCNETEVPGGYFESYKRFLVEERRWPKSTVDTLSQTSSELIKNIPQPEGVRTFQERGLIVGYIQSGKTANMAALIARAADQGYKLFIVLGGFWNDLRSQTQTRLDKEITGKSENEKEFPYVIHASNLPAWARLTTSGFEGDFVGGINDINPMTPKLAVIKKNSRIENLTKWLLKLDPTVLAELPAIIIDDEADQGSIDTNYPKKDADGQPIDPTATNRRIRELLGALPKAVYIGFTATPFANVLIDSNTDDLYPKNFIMTLPEPVGYFGPRRLFGLGMSPSDLVPDPREQPDLKIIREVEESELDEIEEVLEKGIERCPAILSEAILAFILSSCARLARGQTKDHFSMLVHPSPRTDPQEFFAGAIVGQLAVLREAAANPDMFPGVMERAKYLWNIKFRDVTQAQHDPLLLDFDFDVIWKFAKELVESIQVKVLNYYSEDKLDYTGSPKRYIVVGGNRLSRGLTLEGLSVSVFTRTRVNQYDTLLQMGRWFGFRPGYHDLTRIYVDRRTANNFADLARIEEELRADLKKYTQQVPPLTPIQLKPLIRMHSAMAITSRMKMGAGRPESLSFQNRTAQTVTFPIESTKILEDNLRAGEEFINALQEQKHDSASGEGTHIWTDVPYDKILGFFKSYEFSRDAREINREYLMDYIQRQVANGELQLWDVVLPRGNPELDKHAWTKDVVSRKVIRKSLTSNSIKVLLSPGDVQYWESREEKHVNDPRRGCIIFYLIDKKSGLTNTDILGFVLKFPQSSSAQPTEYVSQ